MAGVINGAPPGWYVSIGGTVAGSVPIRGSELAGVLGGGEISVACYGCLAILAPSEPPQQRRPDFWIGGYADVFDHGARDQIRVTLGPEFGFHAVGMDGGLVIARDDTTHFGGCLRGFAGIGVMHATARVLVLPPHALGPTDVMLELGGTFKLPIWVSAP